MAKPVITWETGLEVEFGDKIEVKVGKEVEFIVRGCNIDVRLKADFTGLTTKPKNIGIRVVSRIKLLDSIPKFFSFTFSWRVFSFSETKQKGIIALYDAVCIGDGKVVRKVVPGFVDTDYHFEALTPFEDAIKKELDRIHASEEKEPLELASKVISKGGFTWQKMSITKYEKMDRKAVINFKNEVAIYRCEDIEYCSIIPRPPYEHLDSIKEYYVIEKTIKEEGTKILPAYELLGTISDIARKKEQAVLVTGSPGSGKDVAADLISRLSLMDYKKKHALSVAGYSPKTLKAILFGKVVDGDYLPGLIDEAQDGLIFLDEFDKVGGNSKEFYASLLRVLESREYLPENGKRIRKYENVRWVFAGAFDNPEAEEKIPRDFYSRMTDFVSIKNPLHNHNPQRQDTPDIAEEYFENMFCHFYLRAVCVELGVTASQIADEKSGLYGCWFARVLLGIKEQKNFEPGNNVTELSEELRNYAQELINGDSKNRRLTTRAIIKATAAMASKARDIVVTTGDFPQKGTIEFNDIVKAGKDILQRIVVHSATKNQSKWRGFIGLLRINVKNPG